MRNRLLATAGALCIALIWQPAAFAKETTLLTTEQFFDLSLAELLEVPVETASAREELVDNAPANIYVITAQDIEARGYRKLADILADMPGTIVNSQAPSKDNYVVIRGHTENRRLKLMINGMEINPRSGKDMFSGESRFPINMIKRVEFIVGPYAALYGRNSFSGVLNIITKKGRDVEGGQASLYYEAPYDHYKTDFMTGYRVGRFEGLLSLYANKSYTGRDLIDDYPNKYSIEAREQERLRLGMPPIDPNSPTDFYMNWENEDIFIDLKHDSGLSLTLDYNHLTSPKVGADFKPHIYYQNDDTYGEEDLFNSMLSYFFEGNFFDSTTTATYHYYEQENRNGYLDNRQKWYRDKNNSFEFEERLRFYFQDINELLVGFSYERLESYLLINSERILDPPLPEWGANDVVVDHFVTITLQDQHDITDNLRIVAGLMYEKSHSHADIILPRFSVLWKIADRTNLKLLYGAGFLGVDPMTTVDQDVGGTDSIKGVSDLKPEEIDSYEASLIHYFSENIRVITNIFYNEVDEILETVDDSSLPPPFTQTHKNLGSRVAYGSEIAVDATIRERFRVYASYNYVDGYTKGPDGKTKHLPGTAPHHFKIGVNALMWENRLNLSFHDLFIDAFETYSGEMLDGYNLVDITLNTTPKLFKNWTASLQVKNLFDKKGYDPPVAPAPFMTNIPLGRRTVNLLMTYRW